MFRRVILDNWMSIFPFVAFASAACIYVYSGIKAFRMRSAQTQRFENLPFDLDERARHEKQT